MEKNKIIIEIDVEKLFSTRKEDLLFEAIKQRLDESWFIKQIQDRLIQKILEDKMAEDIKKSFLEKFTKWTTKDVEMAVHNCRCQDLLDKVMDKVIEDNEDIVKKPILEFLNTEKFSENIGKLIQKGIKRKIIHKLNFDANDGKYFSNDCDDDYDDDDFA